MPQDSRQARETVRVLPGTIGTISSRPFAVAGPRHDELEVLKPILEDFPIGIIIVDERSRFLIFNAEARHVLAMGALDGPAADWPETYGCYLPDRTTLFPPEQMPLARALRGEEVTGQLMFIRNRHLPEGGWIRVSSRPLPSTDGKRRWAVAVFADVTDQRQALEEVSLLSRAVEQTADSVVITDSGGAITYVNAAFEQTTGYSREEAIGKTPRILKSGEHAPGFYRALWARLLDGRPFQGTLRNRKKNGDLYWVEQTITPIVGDAGEITNFVSVLKDITESRKQQEHQIQMRLAREVQQRFYARTVSLPGLDVGAAVHPAEQTGGDYVDFITTPDDAHDALGIAVGDVGGHGFDAALVMSLTRAYVRSFCHQGLGVGKVLSGINRMLAQDLGEGRLVTLLLAHADLGNRMLSYASAGHVPGFVLNESGELEAMLESTGIPLGVLDESRFATRFLPLKSGQVIVLMTDGATEAGVPEDFGLERVIGYVREHRKEPGQQIADGVHEAIRAFTNGSAPQDDISMVVLKIE